ncbi:MAG: ATP-binding cassette domain-containing protein [Bacilli bacterium]|nr:ATP-binding cassette domain-containing protein [Bacilli bacterium]
MIELVDISYRVDNKQILDNVNIKFDSNFTVITGPNGSGKSTLAKIIMGIVKPTSGKILYNGEDITSWSIDKRANEGISFSFQQPVKFKGLTVHDLINISSGEEMTVHDACEVLSKVGLCAKEYIDREIDSSLSGGELKRIEIASVSVRNSKITLFDEPEAGIDLWSFNNLIKIFKDLREKNNSKTIIISHQERIINIADKIILLENGKVKEISDSKELDNVINVTPCCKVGGELHE